MEESIGIRRVFYLIFNGQSEPMFLRKCARNLFVSFPLLSIPEGAGMSIPSGGKREAASTNRLILSLLWPPTGAPLPPLLLAPAEAPPPPPPPPPFPPPGGATQLSMLPWKRLEVPSPEVPDSDLMRLSKAAAWSCLQMITRERNMKPSAER